MRLLFTSSEMGRSSAARLMVRRGGGLFCGVVAAHAVDSAAWWCGRGTDVEVADGGGVVAPGGAEEELAEIYGAAGDVAADQVGVHFFQGARGKDAAGQDAIAEAGGETFDLRFDGWQHVDGGAVGYVAIGPGDVLPCWGASGIEKAWLREQDERAIGVTAVAHVVFGGGDFLKAAAQMDGGGAGAVW